MLKASLCLLLKKLPKWAPARTWICVLLIVQPCVHGHIDDPPTFLPMFSQYTLYVTANMATKSYVTLFYFSMGLLHIFHWSNVVKTYSRTIYVEKSKKSSIFLQLQENLIMFHHVSNIQSCSKLQKMKMTKCADLV